MSNERSTYIRFSQNRDVASNAPPRAIFKGFTQ
jgi:hypothetical protein